MLLLFPLRRHFIRMNCSAKIVPISLFEKSRSVANVGRVTNPRGKPKSRKKWKSLARKRTPCSITAGGDDGKEHNSSCGEGSVRSELHLSVQFVRRPPRHSCSYTFILQFRCVPTMCQVCIRCWRKSQVNIYLSCLVVM